MKASIQLDKNGTTARLHGTLGIINIPYSAVLELTRPTGKTDELVVPSSGNETWEVTLEDCAPGNYDALIRPREDKAFEATRLKFGITL
ncbi:hypothetical protein ACU5P1_02350 [Pseudomonas plecoglossicida]|uniref:Uncharacterized protein n=1 Tax=Pseudomonas plecoglossicida TaxID=70775 RepID=A0AAD0QXV3_PSEDL|nr:hypothetical protein [Pseudomonas plecoglossicida]AXM96888.1 hypothetical protein DVB73_14410 [Pseudomonas plecoglossicida]EPB93617.1 hypothetical protein L321_22642 [Pseudomonas plecoglossicida NB2011]QLB53741.1 hypothetical protein HAV28_02340 [Pseudomonas plecoglossicida]GLR36893.1 hypothetical protein GCM10011247_22900 [Pseudomonas plecoglossicida]